VIPEASRAFIEVQEVSSEKTAALLRAPARITFRDGAVSKLGAPLPGRVQAVHVRSGDSVKAGEPLVTLDCPDAASSRASLSVARAAQREAQAALQRETHMLEQGVGTEKDRLAAERALAEADAELVRAQAAARFVGNRLGTTVVLRAPIAGVVVSRNATVGAAVDPGGEPLVEVGDPSELWVQADIFERDLHLVQPGLRAFLELPTAYEPLAGTVAFVGATIESDARTAPVRINLDATSHELRPGMFGRVRIETPRKALALPTEAVLIKDGGKSFVDIQTEPGVFVARQVAVSQPVEGKVLITSGIAPGDQVVVRGSLLLDGAAAQLL